MTEKRKNNLLLISATIILALMLIHKVFLDHLWAYTYRHLAFGTVVILMLLFGHYEINRNKEVN